MKKLTKDEHYENLKKIREFIIQNFPEYQIDLESVEYFIDAELRFVLKGKYKC